MGGARNAKGLEESAETGMLLMHETVACQSASQRVEQRKSWKGTEESQAGDSPGPKGVVQGWHLVG